MYIVDTTIHKHERSEMLRAFLYGQLNGKYKLYEDIDTGMISIGFENDEDATAFKLKALDEIFNNEFGRSPDPFGIGQAMTPPATYAPNAHTHLGTTQVSHTK